MSFDNVFGGGTLQTTEVAYRAFSFSADTTLNWPQFGGANYAARTMDATPTLAGLSLTLPPANQVSTGYDLLISNRGASPFSVKNSAGTMIVTVGVGESKYVQVTDNTSEAGAWNSIAFGAVPSAADAASLAGYGVAASGSTLIASQPVSTFSSNYTIVGSDRARTYVWTGGSGTLSLTAFGTLGSDFWFEVRNQGSGALTIDPAGAEQIDGSGTIVLQPTESCIVHAGAAAWYTVGRGRSVQFSFTLLVKGITGGTVTLTSTEAANVVQRYTGVLVSNADIVLPSVVQVYYVSNQTTGAFTVTFKTAGVGTTVSVPTGQNAVLFCDGLNVINTSTTISGLTALTLSAGSAGVPSLNYSGDTSTGLYSPTSAQVAISISGTQRFLVTATGLTTPGDVNAATLTLSGLASAATAPTLPAHLANKAYVDSVVAGGGYLPLIGGTMTGTIRANIAEGLRLANDAGFLAGYNTANTIRTGYLQFNTGTNVQLRSEATNSLIVGSAGGTLTINSGGAAAFSGGLTAGTTALSSSGSTATLTLTDTGASGANLRLVGDGATTPNKIIRVKSGVLEFIDSGYANVRMSLTDAGLLTVAAGVNSPGYFPPSSATTDTPTYGFGNANGPSMTAYGNASGGVGQLIFSTSGASQVVISNVAGATRYLAFGGSNGGDPTVTTNAGSVRFNAAIKSAAAGTPDVSLVNIYVANDKLCWADSSRSANNREAEFLWSGGSFIGRFVNDAYSAATTWLTVIGGHASGVSDVEFYVGASNLALRLNSSGYVASQYPVSIGSGITPSYPLDVLADAAAFGINVRGRAADGIAAYKFSNNSNVETARVYVLSDGTYNIANASATLRFKIDSAGYTTVGNISSSFGTAGRGTFEVGGTAEAIVGFQGGTSGNAYMLQTSSGLSIINQANTALGLGTNNITRLQITNAGVIQDAAGLELGFKGLPSASVTSGAFAAADRGKCVFATAGVTVPNSTMAAGDVVVIQNTTGSAVTITATITTLRQTGTANTGNRTLAAYGRCAILFSSSTLGFISGDVS